MYAQGGKHTRTARSKSAPVPRKTLSDVAERLNNQLTTMCIPVYKENPQVRKYPTREGPLSRRGFSAMSKLDDGRIISDECVKRIGTLLKDAFGCRFLRAGDV